MLTSIASFGNDLRRVMILSHLLDNSVEYLNMNDQTPGFLASAGQDIRKAVARYKMLLKRSNPGSWAMIEDELRGDRVQDLSLLMEEMMTVQNVEEVIQMIRISRIPAGE